MKTPRDVLDKHVQHYPKSCAASGMELVVKLHDFEPDTFREIQDRYGDTNIGFEKLVDLAAYGIKAKDHELPVIDGFKKIEEEVADGRFPLVSLPSSLLGWHIWVAVREISGLRFLSRGHGIPTVLDLPDSPGLRHAVATYRQGKVHLAVYEIQKNTA